MNKKVIYIGADAAGYALKEQLKTHLTESGYTVIDCGTDSDESCHYPVFASRVCEAVQASSDGAFGLLVCGTGIGMSMCANKHRGIRAAVVSDPFSAEMTRAHNDANVLCLGARVIDADLAKRLTDIFLATPFDGGRHQVRLDLMRQIENKN